MPLDYEIRRDGKTLSVRASGALNATAAPKLEAALAGELDGADELVVDLGGLQVISSMGLRLLLSLYRRMEQQHGSMRVTNVSGQVRETFDVTGFADIFGIGGKAAP